VFATVAHSWDVGRPPYRDSWCNNFPGTIYLFWLLGKVFGWGDALPLYATDASLVVGLGVALLVWSRRLFASVLPGLVGYLTFLSYYLSLDYSQAAQRDWHGPLFMVLGLLIVQARPGVLGRLLSAFLAALALTFRPQTVLLLPAHLLVIDGSNTQGSRVSRCGRGLAWLALLLLCDVVLFLPILRAGVMTDFLSGVMLTAYGRGYNRVTLSSVATRWLSQAAPLHFLLVPCALGLLLRIVTQSVGRAFIPLLAAMAGVSLYGPLSPFAHAYLAIPLMLVWSVNVSALTGGLLGLRRASPVPQLIAIMLVIGLGTSARPSFCALGPTARAFRSLGRERAEREAPPGYRPGTVPCAAFYPWEDYRDLLEYLRKETGPDTAVANALKGVPAITGPAARRSAFPAESLAWLWLVKPEDETVFAQDLLRTRDSVVVWVPGEAGPDPAFRIDRIENVIRNHYQPTARFGRIEVWCRRSD
jgi:hypothetical protein